MKRLVRVFLAVTAITLGFGQIVSAADLPVKAPVAPVAAPDWTGFYIGLNTGGSIGTGSASQNAAFNSAAIGANGSSEWLRPLLSVRVGPWRSARI